MEVVMVVVGQGGMHRDTAHRLIDQDRHDEDSATYVSSISIESMGLGGSMPRPEGRDLCLRSIKASGGAANKNTNSLAFWIDKSKELLQINFLLIKLSIHSFFYRLTCSIFCPTNHLKSNNYTFTTINDKEKHHIHTLITFKQPSLGISALKMA